MQNIINNEDNSKLSIINNRIKNELCLNTLDCLNDYNLLELYKKCPSVDKSINKLKNILDKNNLSIEIQENIINEYIFELIPPGTKGVIRGNKFNEIVKIYINNLCMDINRFDIKFEKKHNIYLSTEIPDWYIYDKYNNKIIIGMNQLDLWSGGQQLNRGYKYIINNIHNTENSKLLCIVCNYINIKSEKNKVFKLFDIGFKNNTLCYLNNLKNIINDYFNI